MYSVGPVKYDKDAFTAQNFAEPYRIKHVGVAIDTDNYWSNSHFAGCDISKGQLGQAVIAIQKKITKVGLRKCSNSHFAGCDMPYSHSFPIFAGI